LAEAGRSRPSGPVQAAVPSGTPRPKAGAEMPETTLGAREARRLLFAVMSRIPAAM